MMTRFILPITLMAIAATAPSEGQEKIIGPVLPESIIEQTINRKESDVDYINMGDFVATAYCPCYECSEGHGHNTASQVRAKEGRTVAVDPSVISYGTKLLIDGKEYIAEDCGGAIKGDRIDIFMENHDDTEKFGRQVVDVKIVKEE